MSVKLLLECAESHSDSVNTIDFVFFDGATSNSDISPWNTANKSKWIREWLPRDLRSASGVASIRVFSATYNINVKSWNEQFPLLETSKQFLHLFKKKQIGITSHSTFFFAWGFDSLLLKQIIYISLIDNNAIFSSILGVVFFGAIPLVKQFDTFREEIEKYTTTHKIPLNTLSSRVPALLDLHHVFTNLAKKHCISCLSYGSIFKESTPGVNRETVANLLAAKEFGDYFYLGDDPKVMANFETQEDFGYFNTVQWLLEKIEIQENSKRQAELRYSTTLDAICLQTFTLGIRDRSVVLSKGRNTTEDSFKRIGKEISRHPLLIDRIHGPSLFEAIQTALHVISELTSMQGGNKREKAKEFRKLLETEENIDLYIVGERRKISIVKAFIGATFQFTDGAGESYFPASLHFVSLEISKVVYDMDLALRHVIYVKQLLNTWKEVNKWSPNRQEEFIEERKIIKQLTEYMKTPVTIAIVGRTNSGKSVFINGILGRNILPTFPNRSTGTLIEFCYVDEPEDEKAEIYYMNEEQVDQLYQKLNQQIDIIDELIASQENIDYYTTDDILNEMQSVKENILELIQKVKDDFLLVQSQAPSGKITCQGNDILSKRKRDTKIRNFLRETSVHDSPIRYRLIKRAIVYLHHPLLKSVRLLETPGLSGSVQAEHVLGDVAIQGWLYFVPLMNTDQKIHKDICKLQTWCKNGVVCITKFDEAISGLNGISLSNLISQKRDILSQCITQESFPAVSMSVLQKLSHFSSKNRNHIESELESLIQAHVGEYFTVPDHLQTTGYSSSEESQEEEEIFLNFQPFAKYLKASCPKGTYHQALQDTGKEASLLMPLLSQIYDKIDSNFITEKFTQLLCALTTHLSQKIIILSQRLQDTAFEIQDQAETQRRRSTFMSDLDIIQLEAAFNGIQDAQLQLKQQLLIYMENEKEKLVQELLESHGHHKHSIRKRIQRWKQSFSGKQISCNIFEQFTQPLTEMMSAYLYHDLFSVEAVERLLEKFPESRDTVVLSIQGILAKQILHYSNRDEIIRYQDHHFADKINSAVDMQCSQIKEAVLTQFNNIFKMILGSANFQIRQKKGFVILRQQNSCTLAPLQPLSLLYTKLNILGNEFAQLQNLFSSIMFVFLQHKNQEQNRNLLVNDTRTLLHNLCFDVRLSKGILS